MRKIFDILYAKFRLEFYKLSLFFCNKKDTEKNEIPIDVIIPAINKNLDTLPLCIQGIRSCVTQKISNIYVVAPKNNEFLKLCEKENVIFIDENTVLGYSVKDIQIIAGGIDRSGWIFQQFLKLSGTIGTERYFLVCDADHILLKPHCFITKSNKFIFYKSTEYHSPYYSNMQKLIGIKRKDHLSYVSHKMIFDKVILAELKNKIEKKHQMSWDKAIIMSLDTSTASPFSEYEMYGHYVSKKNKINKPWGNKNLNNREISPYAYLQKKYAENYFAVTFPKHSIYINPN